MDFKLTDEQELIVDSYREYMESENWETYFHECDEKHEYPLRWVKGLCELGFDQIMLPESHGGLGLEQPCVTLMAVYEVLGRYGAPTYVLYQLPGFETVIREGSEEQIEAVLSTLGSGEQIWNSACTEPGAGSDLLAGREVPRHHGEERRRSHRVHRVLPRHVQAGREAVPAHQAGPAHGQLLRGLHGQRGA